MVFISRFIKYFQNKFRQKDEYFDDQLVELLNKELEEQESGIWNNDHHPYTAKIIELNNWTDKNIYSKTGDETK